MMRKWMVLLLGCLLPFLAAAETRLKVKDVIVKGRPAFDVALNHGYAEYLFSVENQSPDAAHRVEVVLAGYNKQNGGAAKVVTVPPMGRSEFSLFLDRRRTHLQIFVSVDGGVPKTGGFRGESNRGNSETHLLTSKSVNQDDLQRWIETFCGWSGVKRKSSEFGRNYSVCRTDLAPQEWSENWLAYSSVDGILLNKKDLDEFPPKVLTALKQYVEAGGVLSILGGGACPFKGNTVQLVSEKPLQWSYAVGLGICFVNEDRFLNKENGLGAINTAWDGVKNTFRLNRNEGQVNKEFVLIDSLGVPVRGFLLLVVVFAVVVGPLTLYLIAKFNRRIWLLWLVPLEALVACLIVLIYSLVSEGITPTVRLAGMTLLDQEAHRATTLGWAGYYCPQRPADGLFFASDWELLQIKNDRYHRQDSPARRTDWTRGQHLSNGWVAARVPSFFMCRRSAVRRERLECSVEPDGSLAVVNGLGADITKLWLRDAAGNVHYAERIQAGQRVALKPKTAPSGAKNLGRIRKLFTTNFRYARDDLSHNPHRYMVAGSYVAVLDGAPFMENGLGDKRVHLTESGVVYGILPKEAQ